MRQRCAEPARRDSLFLEVGARREILPRLVAPAYRP